MDRLAIAVALLLLVVAPSSAFATKRAFVVGNQFYLPALKGTQNGIADAKDIAHVIRRLGFVVAGGTPYFDLTKRSFGDHWREFLKTVAPGDQVLIYYSGHGAEITSVNYLVPKVTVQEFDEAKSDASRSFIAIPELIESLNRRKPGSVVWILDACRSAEGLVKGLKSRPETGTAFFFYSSESAQKSEGYAGDRNSVFTRELLYAIKMYPTMPLNIVAKIVQRRVRNRVISRNLKTVPRGSARQNPAFYDSLPVPWCFSTCDPGQLIEISYFSGKTPVNETDARSFLRSLPDSARKLNAVFVGRETTLSGDCIDRSPSKQDSHAFGCGLVYDFSEGYVEGLIGKEIIAKTAVNIRRQLPLPNVAGRRSYGCVVKTIDAGSSVKIAGVFEIVYAGEIFYWATIDASEECPTVNSTSK